MLLLLPLKAAAVGVFPYTLLRSGMTQEKRPPCVRGAPVYGWRVVKSPTFHNPSVKALPCHLPLHRGGYYGAKNDKCYCGSILIVFDDPKGDG